MNLEPTTCAQREKKIVGNCRHPWWPAGAWLAGFWGAVVIASSAGAVDIDTLRIGSWPQLPNEMVRGIAAVDDRVYVAYGQNGFSIFEMRQETNLVWRSEYHARGAAQRVAVSGNYAYVAMSEAGLHILDVTDPQEPKLAAVFDTPGTACDVVLTNGLAYVADGESGLQIIDVSTPTQPQRVGEYDTPGTALGVALRGEVALVADGPAGLHALDVAHPSQPILLASNPTNHAYRVILFGSYAYVLGKSCQLAIIDAAHPVSLPRLLYYSMYSNGCDIPQDAVILGNHLYIARGEAGLHIADISVPDNPQGYKWNDFPCSAVSVAGNRVLLGGAGLRLAEMANTNLVIRELYKGDFAADNVFPQGTVSYVTARQGGLRVLDMSHPAQPRQVGLCDAMQWAQDVDVRGHLAYVADGAGLKILEVSDPKNPHVVGSCNTLSNASHVALYGNYTYVSDSKEGLQVVDVSDSTQPRIVGNYGKGIHMGDVQVFDHYAYVSAGQIHVLDVANPIVPNFVTALRAGIFPRALRISNGWLLAADESGWSSFTILDLQSPAAPREVGAIRNYLACGVAGAGNSLFGGANEGVYWWNCENPAQPRQVAYFPSGGSLWDMSVDGNLIYLSTQKEGLKIYERNKLANPQRKGELDIAGWAQEVAVLGHYAYVVDETNGVVIVDLTDPAFPIKVGTLAVGHKATVISISGNMLGAAAGTNGVAFFNLSDPEHPGLAGIYQTSNAKDVVMSGTVVYVADGSSLLIVDVSTPQNPRLVGSEAVPMDSLEVSGNVVVAYEKWNRVLYMIDVSNPTAPKLLQSQLMDVGITDMEISDKMMCVVQREYSVGTSVLMMDISDPSTPRFLSRFQSDQPSSGSLIPKASFPPSITMARQYAYLSTPEGLEIFDMSYLSKPVRVGGNTSFAPVKVTVGEDCLVAAAGKDGVVVLNPFTPVAGSGMSFSMKRQPGPTMPSLRVAGVPGVAVELQRSTNLQSWQTWTNVTLSTNAVVIEDPENQTHSQQYYRAVAP